MKRIHLSYSEARTQILDADLLQFRPSRWNLLSRAINIAGRSPYSHSAMAARMNGNLHAIEVREFIGGRTSLLLHLVQQYPRRIDVFRPCDSFAYPARDGDNSSSVCTLNRKQAVQAMLLLCKPGEYGFFGLFRAALRHGPFMRWFCKVERDIECPHGPPFCSQAYAEAIRQVFVDPVPNLPWRLVEPGDLTRSPLLANYLFTLVP